MFYLSLKILFLRNLHPTWGSNLSLKLVGRNVDGNKLAPAILDRWPEREQGQAGPGQQWAPVFARAPPGSAPSRALCPASPRRSPASTSALEDLSARRFRGRRVELFGLEAVAMAVFAGPAKPFLSLNPQEEAKFQKEVAQSRRRATQVSSHRGPN